jgi:hypothetical protein
MYEFKPFDKVLMRDSEHEIWEPVLFSGKVGAAFKDTSLSVYRYCIPYEGNEHLAGTYNAHHKEFQEGELVAFSNDKKMWYIGFFNKKIQEDEPKYTGYRATNKHIIQWRYCEPAKKHFDIFMSGEK